MSVPVVTLDISGKELRMIQRFPASASATPLCWFTSRLYMQKAKGEYGWLNRPGFSGDYLS
ncbi:MAG: hypothetical protein EBU46_20730 [Nitrosomonadaceae bacterium]|nr:hypothetical protein [Nitrosomonadaceae bacterium]